MTDDLTPEPAEPTGDRSVGKPLVFISHDSRDADLAEAVSKLLTNVSAGMLKSFRSSDRAGVQGIDYGVEWYPELMRKLDDACDVVCLLTTRSLGRPWILYEAGVAKGKLDISVHGLALGVPLSSVSTGPFAQFHNCDDDADSLAKLVEQLVRRLPHADPNHEMVMGQVAAFKERVDEILAAQVATEGEAEVASDDASPAKLFEEIKVMFQDLPGRIDAAADQAGRSKSRGRRLHPEMLRDMVMMSSRGEPNAGFAAMMMLTPLRDDAPWLYSMAEELYRTSLAEDHEATRRGFHAIVRAVEELQHGPFLEMMGSPRRDVHRLLADVPFLLERFAHLVDGPPSRDPADPDGNA